MSKIAIVGVDGSGKTVLMSALGEKYECPDDNGFFLSAATPATFNVVKMMINEMRHGRWPAATERDIVTSLDWKLFRRVDNFRELVCDFSFLDYAGEIYRLAFGEHSDDERANFRVQIKTLKKHIESADALIVLVNLKDVISGDLSKLKTRETLWLTKDILDFAIGEAKVGKVALVFSQAAVYRRELEASGGLEASYRKFLPHVESMYPRLKLFAVSAIDRTLVDDAGFEIPAPDFSSQGLEELMEWIISCVPGYETFFSELRERPVRLWQEVEAALRAVESIHNGGWKTLPERMAAATRLKNAVDKFSALSEAERRCAVDSKRQDDAFAISACNFEYEAEFVHIMGDITAANELESVSRFRDLADRFQIWSADEPLYLSEINGRLAQAKAKRESAVRRCKVAAGIVACCAVCGLGALTADKIMFHLRVRRAEKAARIKLANEKRQLGYTVSGEEFRWVEGVVVPLNGNLVTGAEEGSYVSLRPGYVCAKGSLTETWQAGLRHKYCDDLLSAEEEGRWVSTLPGYIWDGGSNRVWRAGLSNPHNSALVSEAEEGKWKSIRDGYVWVGGVDTAWKSGLEHSFDRRLVSLPKEGEWATRCIGYVWDGLSNAVWKAGLTHPENSNLTSANREGCWRTNRPGYIWSFLKKCEVWTAGLCHPQNGKLLSGDVEGCWTTNDPGYVWDGKTGLEWKVGLRHPKEPSLISAGPNRWFSDKPGYRWDGKDGIVWTIGVIHPQNNNLRSAEQEGEWKSVRPGYKWVAGTVTDVWCRGLCHPQNGKLLSGDVEGCWTTDEPGYAWNGSDGLEWKTGVVHPRNSSLISSEQEGRWKCVKAGYVWDKGSECKWMPGMTHPQNVNLESDYTVDQWKSTKPGYAWTGYGAEERWQGGIQHPIYTGWVSQWEEGKWVPKSGYKKKHFFSGVFSEVEPENRPTGRYVAGNPILGTLRGLSVVLAAPLDIIGGAFKLHFDTVDDMKKNCKTQQQKDALGLSILVVMPFSLGLGSIGGSFFCLGDVLMGTADILTFGWAGDYYFYNDNAMDLKPWVFKRSSVWSFK